MARLFFIITVLRLVFAHGHVHLLMDANRTLYQNEYAEVIIPCRPTTPNVSIVLKIDDMKVIENVRFDDKIGFTLWVFFKDDINNISCEASNNGTFESQHFLIHRNFNAIHLKINDGNSDPVIFGQNLTINCSFSVYPSTIFTKRWTAPRGFDWKNSEHVLSPRGFDSILYFDAYESYTDSITIRNVSEKDNGVYSCEVKYEDTGFTHREYFILKVIHILIKPEIPEITLQSDTNYSMICCGDVPVTWIFDEYGATKINSTIKPFDENAKCDKYEYRSTLSLTEITYLNVGKYYCGPKSVKFEKRISDFNKIYIFVQDNVHLLMDANRTLYQNEYAEVIIPCRPTTPNVSIVLKIDDMKVIENVRFDDKIGFTLWFFFKDDINYITCEASDNGTLERQHFLIHRNVNAIHLKINDGNSDPVIFGQNLTINCSFSVYFSTRFTKSWIAPGDFDWENSEKVWNPKGFESILYFDGYNSITDSITIRNVSEKDNGVYSCKVTNVYTGFTHRENFILKVIHILIKPEIPEITLQSDTNYSMICCGDVPVTWIFDEYGATKINSTIKPFDENAKCDKYEYRSTLSLTEITYLNVGKYYCGPKSVKFEKWISDFNKIYIFVQDNVHLLMDANRTLYQNEYAEVIIPCRPTTPNVSIVLKIDDMKVIENVRFDDKIGFTLWFFFKDDSNNITCEASDNGTLERQHFLIHRNVNAIHLKINDGNSDPVIFGQNLTINCSITAYPSTRFTHRWLIPMGCLCENSEHVLAPKDFESKLYFDEYKSITDLITIRNVSEKDNGVYSCEVKYEDTGFTHREYFILKVIHILIKPEIPEITLQSDTNYSMICCGDVPVTWIFDEYGATKINSTIKPFDENAKCDKYEYRSTLSLTEITYLNVGKYYCGPKSVKFEKRISDFNKIYIFVQDNVHLLMDANRTLYQNEYAEVIIPCRPTTPNVSIVLKIDDMKVIENVRFDDKIGFTLWFFFKDDINYITCEASDNGTLERQHFLIHRNVNAIHLKINDGNSDPVIFGQNLTINCSFSVYPSTIFTKRWTAPRGFDWKNSEHVLSPRGFDSILYFDAYESYTDSITIRNVSNKDNGVYSCEVTNDDTGLIHTVKYTLDVIHNAIIWPNVSHLVLKKKSSKNKYALICKGREPIQWLFRQHDGHLVVKKNNSITAFPTSQNKLTYISLLLLDKASYLDVGYYYCLPMFTDLKSLEGFKRIYIYIEHESHLLVAYGNTSVEVLNNVHIPCLPTSPDVDIRIITDAADVTSKFKFDNKTGFTSNYKLSSRTYLNMKCFANSSRNNISDNRTISNFMESTFNINNGLLYDAILGQNITINCSSSLHRSFAYYSLKWIYRKTIEKKTNYIQTYQNNNRSVLLSFPNLTTEDEGKYKCMATSVLDLSLRTYKTYTLKAYKPHETFLNLRIIAGKKKEIRPAGYKSVQWIVQVSTNINASLQWTGPNGQHLTKSKRTNVVDEENSSLLVIRDLQLSDSGIYSLNAYNEAISNEIKVILFVEEKPSVSFINMLNSSAPFYEIGKNYNFEFHIYGYPLANVECTFTKYHNYPLGETLHSELKDIKAKTTRVSESILKLVISMNITNIGTLTCKASNSLGICFKRHTVLVLDTPNALEIRGPPVIFEGDDVTIECIAPKYKYLNDFKWIYLYDDQTKHLVHTIKNETEFSYYSYLTINKISKKYIGYINCSANLIKKSHELRPETDIKSFTVKLEEQQQRIDGDDDIKVFFLCILLTILIEFLIMSSIIFLKYDKMWQKELDLIRKNNNKIWKRSIGIKEDDYLFPYSKQLEFPRENLILGKQLGSGAYGVVFEGIAFGIHDKNTETPVAVKTVHQNSESCAINSLASELKIMMSLGKHLNVVSLLGMCNSQSTIQRPMVILEYCRYGNIHQYMRKHRSGFVNQITPDGCINCVIGSSSENPIYENTSNENLAEILVRSDGSNNHEDDENTNNKPLSTYDLICWTYQIARALDYLDSLKILHGDLAARNILLADDNIVKLCDFGLARSLSYNEIYEKEPKQDHLPIKWLAIESIRDLIFSRKSDVWSFGIVIWEIFSLASVPYPNIQIYDLLDKLSEGYRMEQPIYANSNIYEIMLDCWKAKPMERPSFDDLCKRLGDLLQQCTKSDYVIFEENDGSTKNEKLHSTSSTGVLPKRSDINFLNAPKNFIESHQNNDHNPIDKNDIEMRQIIHDEV